MKSSEKRLIVEIPKKMHRELKKSAKTNKRSLRDVVQSLVEMYLDDTVLVSDGSFAKKYMKRASR